MDKGTVLMSGQEEPKTALPQKATAAGVREDFDFEAAVFTVCWSHSLAGGLPESWLASGNQVGLVRCQRVMSEG